jgi:hypothetical protein
MARIALVPAGALAVHQLRYVLAFGGSAGRELIATGHSYLHSLVPPIVTLIALAIGVFLRALGRALAGQRSASGHTASFVALWLACAVALVAVFAVQELLEGVFASGHPTGFAAIFGYGGGWSIPAALAVGLILAAVYHGAARALVEIARRCLAPHRSPVPRPVGTQRSSPVLRPRLLPLAGGWSDRGPPGLSVAR